MVRSSDPIKTVQTDLPAALSEAKQAVRAFAQAQFPGADVTITSEIANPLDLIKRAVDATKADLIMMPTHGRGRFRAALLGSLTPEKRRIAEAVIQILERAVPGLSESIEEMDVSTPATVMRYTGNWRGVWRGGSSRPAPDSNRFA